MGRIARCFFEIPSTLAEQEPPSAIPPQKNGIFQSPEKCRFSEGDRSILAARLHCRQDALSGRQPPPSALNRSTAAPSRACRVTIMAVTASLWVRWASSTSR